MTTATNQFLNASEYANVMLLLLKNQLVFGRLVDGQFKDQVTNENGLTINVKRPPRFLAKSGATLQTQDIQVGTAPVTVDQYKNVHIEVGDLEYVQSYNALMQNETMKSAASTLAHDVDKFIAGLTKGFNSWVAGASTGSGNATDPTKVIASPVQAMGAHTRLMAQGVPNADLNAVVDFADGELIRGAMLSQYTPGINQTAMERVKIPLISEIDWYATQQCPTITTGTRTQGNGSSTGAQVNGGTQNVDYDTVKGTAGDAEWKQNLDIDTLTSGQTIVAGEVFTIENVYAWDWRNQQALDYLQQFTVLADVTATSGSCTLSISPPIIVPDTDVATTTDQRRKDVNSAFGTVDSVPANNAHIQFAGAASTKLRIKSAFHKRAISLVSARLQMPFTGVASQAVDPDTGIAIRYWRGSDISTGQHIHRWDMIYGGAVLDRSLGTRLCGS